MRKVPQLLLVTATFLLPGCASSGKTSIIGMPNPASVNCTKMGGKLSILKTPEGEIGMCHLPSGQRCEEWSLFRDHQCKNTPDS